MEAGLLFYFARRTSACQRTLSRSAGLFGIRIAEVQVCTRREDLDAGIARLLRKGTLVFLVGSCRGRRPDCSEQIFRTLKVPLDGDGEPRGVLRVDGSRKSGYVLESADQAILIVPDDPYEILKMLPAAFFRLKRKFRLSGEFPPPGHPDYGRLIAGCMERREDG